MTDTYKGQCATVDPTAKLLGNGHIYGNAQLLDHARIDGHGIVSERAIVRGWAAVSYHARVEDYSIVEGYTCVSSFAVIKGHGFLKSSADFIVIGPAISSGRYTTAHIDSVIGIRVNCGCFSGTVDEFSRQINKTHKSNPAALAQYRAFVSLIKAHFKARDLL